MKRCGHWLSLLCLTVSLLGSPVAVALGQRAAGHRNEITATAQNKAPGSVLLAEKSSAADDVAGGEEASTHPLWPKIARVAEPIGLTWTQIRPVVETVIRAVALQRPLSRGPPARA